MTHKIIHHKVSTVPDSIDPTLVRPSDWNQAHDISWGFATPNVNTITAAEANTPGDPDWGSVSLLMHMEGSNNSTNFIDQRGHSFTASGNAKVSNTKQRFGSTSAYFVGSGDYISTPIDSLFNLGAVSDWTVECWVNMNSITNRAIMSFYKDSSTRWSLEFLSDTTVNCVYMGSFTLSEPITAGVWHHVAIVCIANVTRVYVDGVPSTNTRGNMLATITSGTMAVGWTQYAGFEYYFNGYIDELRITKGVGRYNGDFSNNLPSAPCFDDHPSLTFQDGWNYQSTGPILLDNITIVVPSNCDWVVL